MAARRGAIYVAAFATVASYYLVWPIWRAQFPLEIWQTEGWNAYFQDAASRWQPLYPSPDSLISNNYPPLSFYTIGLLSDLFGDALYVGRALSVIALIAIAIEIALAVVMLGGAPLYGAIGGLWFVAIMAHNSTFYVGANDPQIAGLAIMGAGLVWFLAQERAGRSCLPALLLMVFGGFWKHNIVAIPVTAVIWLAYTRTRRSIGPIAFSIAAAAIGLLACRFLFGPAFFANLLAPRVYSLRLILPHLGHMQWQAVAFMTWLVWFVSARQTSAAQFTALHVSVSVIGCVLQWTGDGVAQNAEFDPMISLGIGIGVALSSVESLPFARKRSALHIRDVVVVLLLLRLLLSPRQESAWVLFSPSFRAAFFAAEKIVNDDVARAAAIPGLVYCDNKLICRSAEKTFVVDEFKIDQMVATGAATEHQVAQLLHSRGITTFISDRRTREHIVSQSAMRAADSP